LIGPGSYEGFVDELGVDLPLIGYNLGGTAVREVIGAASRRARR